MGRGTGIRWTLAAAAAVLAFALVPAAHAASIAYIGGDGNAYLTGPDGARKVQLTTNGAADNKYRMTGQTDAGTVVVLREGAFIWLNRDGSIKSGPWIAPKGNLGTGPLSSHVAPEGGFVVFWASDCTFACSSRYDRIVFMPEGPLADECTINCHDGYVLPRWIPGTPLAGFIDTSLTSVYVQVENSSPQEWFGFSDENVGHFDVSRDRSRVLVETTSESASQPGKLWLLQNNGLPPNPQPLDILCTVENWSADGNGNPVWSVDGSQIAWQQGDGVYVSPAPAPNPDGSCALSPRLIAPGGSAPAWGPQDVPGGGGGGGAGGGRPTVKFSFSGGLPDLAKALRRGVSVKVTSSRAGKATVQLRASGAAARGVNLSATKVVGRGSKKIRRAGSVKVVAKFTRKAKRRYRTKSKVKLTVRVSVKATGGGTTTKQRRVTLRRKR